MATPVTLIQLIGEQTMPNLLAALAFKPTDLVHIATPKTKVRSDDVYRSARQANPELKDLRIQRDLLSLRPGIEDARNAVRGRIDEAQASGRLPVVNFTGGTKLMSIGARDAARDSASTSVYVDTEQMIFSDGGTGEPITSVLGDDLTLAPIQRWLTVNAIAFANGCKGFKSGRQDAERYRSLAAHLRANPGDEQGSWAAMRGKGGLFPNAEPAKAKGWLAAAERHVNLPKKVGKLALEAGLLRECDDGTYALPLPPELEATLKSLRRRAGWSDEGYRRAYRRAIRPLQFAAGFLSGGWWELIVADAVKQHSERFRDVQWSAHAGGRECEEQTEEDVLAVDGVQLAYFSCKRGGRRIITVLEEMDGRARLLGGTHTLRFLCVYRDNEVESPGWKHAERLGIRVITPADLNRPDCFGPASPSGAGAIAAPVSSPRAAASRS